MSRTIGQAGLALIKKFEGCRLTAYQDAVGVWTIGYGHTSGVKCGQAITQAQAEQYLISDCQKFANYVDSVAYVPITASLNDNQRDALISFSFNLGQGNLRKLCAGRSASQIATAMPQYCNAGGKKLAGLVTRRAAEVKLFNTVVAEQSKVEQNQPSVEVPEEKKESEYFMFECPNLQAGDTGLSVLFLQTLLRGRDYREVGLTQTFDSNTAIAVLDLKKRNGLSIGANGDDWNVNKQFWGLLVTVPEV